MGIYLPRWVWIGAGALACVGGMVNVIGYIGFERQAITHLTGTTSLAGAAIAAGDGGALLRLGGVALAFFLGAATSGMIIKDSTLQLGRRYGVVLVLESLLLLASIPLFKRGYFGGMLLAALACGLQNAMATAYSGAVVRTTHVSGMFTDLGIGLGHALRGMPLQVRRLRLSALIITAFLAGGVIGAYLFGRVGYDSLLLPAVLTGGVGLAYGAYRQLSAWRQDTHRP